MNGQKEGRDCSCSYEDAVKLGQWRVPSPDESRVRTERMCTTSSNAYDCTNNSQNMVNMI